MKALVIYDSFALASRANTMIQRATERADSSIDWEVCPWRTEMMKSAAAEQIHQEACDAHLIVFAWRETRPFPSWMESWLEKWAVSRKIKEAAIALVSEGSSFHLISTLRELSRFTERRELCLIIDKKIVLEQNAPEPAGLSPIIPLWEETEDMPA